jgi:hypothetical protein
MAWISSRVGWSVRCLKSSGYDDASRLAEDVRCGGLGLGLVPGARTRCSSTSAGSYPAVAYQVMARAWQASWNGMVRRTALAVRWRACPAPKACFASSIATSGWTIWLCDAFLTAHAPAGMSQASTGEQGGPAGVAMEEVGYAARPVPAGIYAAQLVLTVAPVGPGGSLVRADAQVIWFPPRTAAEYIDPARYYVLTIAVMVADSRPHTMHEVVTSQAVITRLAEALNRSQVEPTTIAKLRDDLRDLPAGIRGLPAKPACRRGLRDPVAVRGLADQRRRRAQPPLEDAGTVVATADRCSV